MAKTVEVDLQVNDNLAPTIKNLKLLKSQLKETAAGSKEFDKLSASIRDMEDAISDAKATNDDFLGQLENASGPLGTLGQGIRAAERTFSSFNGALKASVIGLLVATIGGLVAAFRDNEVAMKKLQPLFTGLEKIFQGVFRAVEPLFNAIVDFAVASIPTIMKGIGGFYSALVGLFSFVKEAGSGYLKIWKGILTLDFDVAKEGIEQLKNSFATAVKAGQDSYKRFTAGTKEMTKSQKEEQSKQAEANKKHQDEINAKNKAAQEERLKKQKEYLAAKQKADEEAREKEKKDLQDFNNFLISIDNANRERRVAEALEKEAADAKVLSDATAVTDALMLEDEKDKKISLDRIAREEAEAKAKTAIRMKALDDLTSIFGAESRAGKAFLIAKQLLQAKELAMEISKTITFSAQAAARSSVAVAEGTAQTAKVGFPQNIPLLIGYAAQAAGIFSAIRSAVKSAKSSAVLPTATSVSEGTMSTTPTSAAPQFNVVGTSGQNQIAQSLGNQAPVKAYVVANDVTTQQSLDRNIVKTATI